MDSLAGQRDPVKRKRAYDATRRRERARQTRDRILDVAERRFLRDGYGSTTIVAIAGDAGVSVDTIFKAFRGKPGLVRAIRERALRGRGPVPAEQRSDDLQTRERDARRIIRAWADLVTEVAPSVSPILLLVRDAARDDPELQSLLEEMDGDRLRRMTDNARRLIGTGQIRPGITVADAANILWTYSSPELYELLVLRRRMPLEKYGTFVGDAMAGGLL